MEWMCTDAAGSISEKRIVLQLIMILILHSHIAQPHRDIFVMGNAE